MIDTYIRLNGMSQYVHTCICCDRRRNALYQLCIQNSLISCKAVRDQRILHMIICIIYNCKRGNLRSGTTGSRNCNKTYFAIIVDLQGKLTDCLGRVNCRAASDSYYNLRLILQELLYTFCDFSYRCIRYNITEYFKLLATASQRVCDQLDHFPFCDEWICDHQNFFVWQFCQSIQGIVTKMDNCFHFKSFHNSMLLYCSFLL